MPKTDSKNHSLKIAELKLKTLIPALKYKICVSGAAETGNCGPDAAEKAELMGRLIAERGLVLLTGATIGIPYWAAKGAKDAGGLVIGFSPASSEAAHLKSYHLPVDFHDVVIYTGFDYSGRNLLLTRASDAIITMCGRMGTLNEFTIGYEDRKPIGVLTGTGGMADMVKEIIERSNRGMSHIVFENDPRKLLTEVVSLIGKEKRSR